MTVQRLFLFLVLTILLSSSLAAQPYQPWSDAVFQHIGQQYGPQAEKRVRYLHDLFLKNQDKSVMEKLQLVNSTMNKLPWIADQKQWEKVDYWATPMEALATFGGDCEDFAIAKWVMLRHLGIPGENLRLAYVKLKSTGESHMVLAYVDRVDIPREERLEHTWILDNMVEEVKKASARKDLYAVYATDAHGNVVVFKETKKGPEIRSVRENAKMSKLVEVKAKIRENMALYQKINEGHPLIPKSSP